MKRYTDIRKKYLLEKKFFELVFNNLFLFFQVCARSLVFMEAYVQEKMYAIAVEPDSLEKPAKSVSLSFKVLLEKSSILA